MKISVSGLSNKDLKLPVYDDPYRAGLRPAIRRGVKALPPPRHGRLIFSSDKPKMTEAATNSWLAVMSSLLLFAAGMIALAAFSGCSSLHSIHVPNLLGGSGHRAQHVTEETKCPVCGEPLDNDEDGNNGKHKGQHKDKNHHVCNSLHGDG